MATKKNGNLSGKLGNEIHSSWNGRPYTRRRPESVANPRTEAQQGHRNAFAEISRLSSKMKAAHLIGLHWKAMREKLNTHCVFKKINKDLSRNCCQLRLCPFSGDYVCADGRERSAEGDFRQLWYLEGCGRHFSPLHILSGTSGGRTCTLCKAQ